MAKRTEKNKILKKPNQAITITNVDITATQRKAYNILLFKAQEELRYDNNKTSFVIALSKINKLAGLHNTDTNRLREDLKALVKIVVEVIEDEKKGDWDIFSLLSQAKKQGHALQFKLPDMVREALIKNDYYTPLDLMIISSLKGKYAVILYEKAIRYRFVEIPKQNIEEFKKEIGVQGYKNFGDLERFCIKPAINEINEKTDIVMDYNLTWTGHKVTEIKFSQKQKSKTALPAPEQPKEDHATEDDSVFNETVNDLMRQCAGKIAKSSLKNLVKKYSAEGAQKIILRAVQADIKNPNAYIQHALKNDYSDAEVQKQQEQIQKEKEQKIQEKETTEQQHEKAKQQAFQQDADREKQALEYFNTLPAEKKQAIADDAEKWLSIERPELEKGSALYNSTRELREIEICLELLDQLNLFSPTGV